MKAKTLIEAVEQITGKTEVSEIDAMLFAKNNYMELCFFHRHEDNMIKENKKLMKSKSIKKIELKTKYSKN